MESENLEELQGGSYVSKEISQLYEANYEEKKKVQELKLRIEELENELKKTPLIKGSSETEDEGPDADQELIGVLIASERKSKDELTELRKLLIDQLEDESTPAPFGVKRMGELDSQPFIEAMKPYKDGPYKAMRLCSLLSMLIGCPEWHPFKIINMGGKLVEVVDEEDEKLKTLKMGFSESVYNAIKTALTEMNEYNPSGRFIVQELWNFKEDRKASLKEVVEFMLHGWTPNKRLRRS
ncbi:factor of DNA methylation 3-like isoform X2 [Humulus lupulus]|uniref:factor of DNA methylation 3-like isoform X2 n=1 Tax=Humulus lupulus TaxID=3486 RepID=UPI002B40BB33|nr:factor of DNA methylation 3-like isoform X2 [Humulus lupulus]